MENEVERQSGLDLPQLVKQGSRLVETVLDLVPCPVAIWSPSHSPYVLNSWARDLMGFSNGNSEGEPLVWSKRIDYRHRDLFEKAWTKLLSGEKMVSCDYRFFPNGTSRGIWLRDVSISYRNSEGEVECVASAYRDISDLHGRRPREDGPKTVEVIRGLTHELKNNLQSIKMGFDLLSMGQAKGIESQSIKSGIDQANKSLEEVHEYFVPPKARYSYEDPGIVLEDVVGQMERQLGERGIRTNLRHCGDLPAVRLDLRQFRNALERLVGFAAMLLPKGGDLLVETEVQRLENQKYVGFRITVESPALLEVEEKDLTRPFLRINSQQVGLSLELARQVIRRHQGKVVFRKHDPHRGTFTIWLKVQSASERE